MKGAQLDTDSSRVEAREVQQLLRQVLQPRALLVQRRSELDDLGVIELVAAEMQGCGNAVDDGYRRTELMRGDGYELVLQLVDAA